MKSVQCNRIEHMSSLLNYTFPGTNRRSNNIGDTRDDHQEFQTREVSRRSGSGPFENLFVQESGMGSG